jgi:hexosaminidase
MLLVLSLSWLAQSKGSYWPFPKLLK